MKVFR